MRNVPLTRPRTSPPPSPRRGPGPARDPRRSALRTGTVSWSALCSALPLSGRSGDSGTPTTDLFMILVEDQVAAYMVPCKADAVVDRARVGWARCGLGECGRCSGCCGSSGIPRRPSPPAPGRSPATRPRLDQRPRHPHDLAHRLGVGRPWLGLDRGVVAREFPVLAAPRGTLHDEPGVRRSRAPAAFAGSGSWWRTGTGHLRRRNGPYRRWSHRANVRCPHPTTGTGSPDHCLSCRQRAFRDLGGRRLEVTAHPLVSV